MRAVRIIDGQPSLETVEPATGEGVRVKVVSSSICGSDLHLVDGGMAEGMILGHEFCGLAPDGTAVAVEPMASCGVCASCDDGHLSHCVTGPSFYGIGLPGGMADEVLVQPEALVPLPTGLDLAVACLVEPLAVATHGLNRARVEPDDRVLVIGAGPIGLAAAAMLRHRGIATDLRARHEHQRAAAERLGASTQVGDGYDVVIDCVATTASLAEAVDRVRPRGRVGLVGTTWSPAEFGIAACMKEVELSPAMTYRCRVPGRDFDEAAAALATAPDIAEAIITHRFPLEGCAEAFATAADRAGGTIKVAFDV
ncbi:MAG: alcohol dehydrogenase catalytic domain-containing protein [Actinomycetota bacterium]